MKGCPIEGWATYFQVDLGKGSDESVGTGDMLSFGRQTFSLMIDN